jgi:sec-independent protein translocase protein TatB
MLDLGWTELMLIATVAVIVLGPKELPNALRTLGQWVRKARRMAGDFQKHLDDVVRESELDDVRREVNRISSTDIGREIDKAIDPDGEVGRTLKSGEKAEGTGSASTKAEKAALTEAPKPVEEKTVAVKAEAPAKPKASANNKPAKPAKKAEPAEAMAQADKKKTSPKGGQSAGRS